MQNGIEVLYEDNHIIILNKSISDLVQRDITGDETLAEKLEQYLKKKYDKPGNVFVGIPHRLDRPVSGVVVFAKTSKALTRLSAMFKEKEISKTYWAVVESTPEKPEARLVHYLMRNTKINKSFAYDSPRKYTKESQLEYKVIAQSDKYSLLEINLITGRHHQIRCQLTKIGHPIRGDVKYGFKRPNEDGGINLHARHIHFMHPVKKEEVRVTAPLPKEKVWGIFSDILKTND
jgi:23S rRNA pseudouridine1911/1915/1917 synthase